MSLIHTFVVKASNRVGLAGGSLGVFPHVLGSSSAVVPVRRVHLVKVHHVLRDHCLTARVGPALQAEHVQEPELEFVEKVLRLLWCLLAGFTVLPSAHLGDKSRSTSQQHVSQQQYHERADHGDHDQSVPGGGKLES